jgi:hypothetical protein
MRVPIAPLVMMASPTAPSTKALNVEAAAASERAAVAEEVRQRERVAKLVPHELPPVDFSDLDYHQAFTLYSVLVAADSHWQENRIGPIATHAGELAPTPDLTDLLYQRLYRSRIIAPSPRSRASAFQFDDAGGIAGFSIRDVEWIIAKDRHGASMRDVFAKLGVRVKWPDADGIEETWNMVAEGECKRYFIEQCERYRFTKDDLYSERVKETVLEYLATLSIGQMWNVIYYVMKDLAALVQERTYSRQHVYNMIPGSIRRKIDYRIANGREIIPWSRRHPSKESWITSILLDKVLGDGNRVFASQVGESISGDFEDALEPEQWSDDESDLEPRRDAHDD